MWREALQHYSPPSRGQASCGSVHGSVAHSNWHNRVGETTRNYPIVYRLLRVHPEWLRNPALVQWIRREWCVCVLDDRLWSLNLFRRREEGALHVNGLCVLDDRLWSLNLDVGKNFTWMVCVCWMIDFGVSTGLYTILPSLVYGVWHTRGGGILRNGHAIVLQ